MYFWEMSWVSWGLGGKGSWFCSQSRIWARESCQEEVRSASGLSGNIGASQTRNEGRTPLAMRSAGAEVLKLSPCTVHRAESRELVQEDDVRGEWPAKLGKATQGIWTQIFPWWESHGKRKGLPSYKITATQDAYKCFLDLTHQIHLSEEEEEEAVACEHSRPFCVMSRNVRVRASVCMSMQFYST